MTVVKSPVVVICVFVWLGFVCAISFMEAWLKFRAPGITLPLGLGIGRIVFSALNRVEWVLAIGILINLLFSRDGFFRLNNLAWAIPLAILIIQTIWLLPALDARAQLHIDGAKVLPSNIHFYYVGMEAVKVLSLAFIGISLFKSKLNL